MDINWSILANTPNAGAAFAEGMQFGQQKRKEAATQNALAAYISNPDDPMAANALAAIDPRLGIQAVERQRTSQETALKRQQEQAQKQLEVIGRLAKVSKTPEMWDSAVEFLAANGMPEAATYKGQFNPEARAAIMAQAGIDDDDGNPTALRQNYEWLSTLNPQLAEQYLRTETTEQPRYYPVPPGGRLELDPSYQGPVAEPAPDGEMPVVASPDDAMKLPPGTLFKTPDGRVKVVPGGAPASPAPTFP